MTTTEKGEPWASTSPAPAVLRAGKILETIAAAPGRSMTVPELAAALQIPRSSTANVCAALEQIGMLSRAGARYRLGRQIVALSDRFVPSTPITARFDEIALDVRDDHDELVHLMRLDGSDVMIAARSAGPASIPLPTRIGQILPAHTTAAGKVLLGELEKDERWRRISDRGVLESLTDATITDPDELRDTIDEAQLRGFAINDEESHPGIWELAVPIDASEEQDRYAVSVWTLSAWSESRQERMHEIARLISGRLSTT